MINGKTVLVTGGTGSFGRQFCAWALTKPVRKLIVFSRDEYKQWIMAKEVGDERVRYFLGDIRDLQRLSHALQEVDTVVHAAALKHVAAMEYNPEEAYKTNIQGTQNVVNAIVDSPVNNAILLSTDKAVDPANLYGATKMVGERLWIAANVHKPCFSFVRYGNVMESRGGVLSVWRDAIARGEHVRLTDPEMTRFWMTYPMAIACVEEALRQPAGLGIVPKAKGCKMVDLLEVLSGGNTELLVDVVGRQPGEKLHESLLSADEVGRTVEIGEFYHIRPARAFDDALRYPRGDVLPPAFTLRSDWTRMTVEEIREKVNG